MSWLVIIENLGHEVTDADVRLLLEPHGQVESIHLERAAAATPPACIASVQVQSSKAGRAAIAALDGREHGGRVLKVRVAKGASGRGQGGFGGVPGGHGRSARASVYGGKGASAGHKGIGKGGGRGL